MVPEGATGLIGSMKMATPMSGKHFGSDRIALFTSSLPYKSQCNSTRIFICKISPCIFFKVKI